MYDREISETFLEYDSTLEDLPLFLTLRSRSVCQWISLLVENYYTSRGFNGRWRFIIDGAGNEGENEPIRRFVFWNFKNLIKHNYTLHLKSPMIHGESFNLNIAFQI